MTNSSQEPTESIDPTLSEQAPTSEAQVPEPVVDPLAEAEALADKFRDQWLRAEAETKNVRLRAQEDVTKAHKFAVEKFAENLLPVKDSLELALSDTTASPDTLREGVALTLKSLISALERAQVKELNPVGEKFDPHQHQAISMVPGASADPQVAPNHVVSVLQKGYVIADRVLRPALVTVAQA